MGQSRCSETKVTERTMPPRDISEKVSGKGVKFQPWGSMLIFTYSFHKHRQGIYNMQQQTVPSRYGDGLSAPFPGVSVGQTPPPPHTPISFCRASPRASTFQPSCLPLCPSKALSLLLHLLFPLLSPSFCHSSFGGHTTSSRVSRLPPP